MDVSDPTPRDQSNTDNDQLEVYKLFRDYAKHEDTLVNFRSTWLLGIQAFLFTIYGATFSKQLEILQKIADLKEKPFLFNKNAISTQEAIYSKLGCVLLGIASLGILISVIGWISIRAAHAAVKNIENIFQKQNPILQHNQNLLLQLDKPHQQKIVNVSGKYLPNIVAGGRNPKFISTMGNLVSQFIPWIYVLAWALALTLTKVKIVP